VVRISRHRRQRHADDDTVDASTVEIVADPVSTAVSGDISWSSELTARDSTEVQVDTDAKVRIVDAAEEGSSSAALGR
jgi:hypothetical protein